MRRLMTDNIAYVGIGSNLGNPDQYVLEAIRYLNRLPETRLDQSSSCYRTAPVDATGDDYVNAVARLVTDLAPESLLNGLQEIENHFGRQRPFRNAPRTLDLDILLYNQQRIRTKRLIIPHPRMAERAFVLVPLSEIAPDLVIPGKEPLPVLLDRVKDQRIDRY